MKRKKKQPRPIARTIAVTVGGRVIKTARHRITLRQATREVGEDRWHTKGDRCATRRRVGVVTVAISYEAVEHLFDSIGRATEVVESNLKDAVQIIRAGMAG